jgi:hypothetical protein
LRFVHGDLLFEIANTVLQHCQIVR